jgi:hypothetical protein
MGEEEKRVSEVFLGTVNEFYRGSDQIFKEFDEILGKYSKGEDIMDDLKAFKSKSPRIFGLIEGIYHKEVEFEDKLDRAKVKQEKRDKMLEFKTRFADLADEIDLLVLGELGLLK